MLLIPLGADTEHESPNECHTAGNSSGESYEKCDSKTGRGNISYTSKGPTIYGCCRIKHEDNNRSDRYIRVIARTLCEPWKLLGRSDFISIFVDDFFDFIHVRLDLIIGDLDESFFFISLNLCDICDFFNRLLQEKFA